MNDLAAVSAAEAGAAAARPRRRLGSPRGMFDFLNFAFLRSVIRRRFWIFFGVTALFAALGVSIAFSLPPAYRSSATILVESQRIPTELARSTVTATAVEQLQIIQQRLMTRETLLAIAEKHRLFADAAGMTPTNRVEAMRASIGFELNRLSQNAYGGNISTAVAFTVSFTAGSSATAAAVAGELVTLILERNAQTRRDRAESTSSFFRSEVERIGAEMRRVEAQLVEMQRSNAAALPGSLEYRRNQLEMLEDRIQRFQLQRVELEQQRAVQRLTLEAEQPGGRTVSAMEAELEALRRTRVQRLAVLSPSHPDIRALNTSIAALERALIAEPPAAETPDAAPDDAQLAARLAVFDAQARFIDEQIAALEAARGSVQRSILESPGVELEVGALRRTYEDLEGQLQAAQGALAQAMVGERLEERQQAERFEIIEQPLAPEHPISPNRAKIAAVSLAGGLAVAGGLVFLLEMTSKIVRRPEDLEMIEIEPFVIPYVETRGERVRRWLVRLAAVAVVFGGSAGGLWLVHSRYLPLETIAQKAVDKAGLAGPIDALRRTWGL